MLQCSKFFILGNGGPKITTEQLDKEMDEYMGGNN